MNDVSLPLQPLYGCISKEEEHPGSVTSDFRDAHRPELTGHVVEVLNCSDFYLFTCIFIYFSYLFISISVRFHLPLIFRSFFCGEFYVVQLVFAFFSLFSCFSACFCFFSFFSSAYFCFFVLFLFSCLQFVFVFMFSACFRFYNVFFRFFSLFPHLCLNVSSTPLLYVLLYSYSTPLLIYYLLLF